MTNDNDIQPLLMDGGTKLGRRAFLVGAGSAGAVAPLGIGAYVTGNGNVGHDPWIDGMFDPVTIPPTGGTRRWLGAEFWGNRLQDWQVRGDRIECTEGKANYEIRTVAALTRELVGGNEPAHLRVRTGIAGNANKDGFCGFLIGIGSGKLDYRSAALCGRASGVGGGTLCTLDSAGHTRFREHTDEQNPFRYATLPAETHAGPNGYRPIEAADEVTLSLDVLPRGNGRFDLDLKALDAKHNGTLLARATRRNVPEQDVLGGIAFVSSPPPKRSGTKWWFKNLRTSGRKVVRHPARTFGPIVGTLYSMNNGVLKMTAQLFPMGKRATDTVRLRYRPIQSTRTNTNTGTASEKGRWQQTTAQLAPWYAANFRVEQWDTTREWEYQVVYSVDGTEYNYRGRIPREPTKADGMTVSLISCSMMAGRTMDGGGGGYRSLGRTLGRYTPENFYFPYETLSSNLEKNEPDLLAFVGDQIYEDNPTRVESRVSPGFDYLYKWFLWLWSFRSLTRNRPTIVLVDDHDVYQKNLWGDRGRKAPFGDYWRGGYIGNAEFVNRLQRVQCSHNPDPYDPAHVDRGISVYYSTFDYGGVSFAIVEDRKFKQEGPNNPDVLDLGQKNGELLGKRQENFLKQWGQDGRSPKICFTQTCWAAARTTPKGQPYLDYDSDGYPKAGRDRAIRLQRDAGALMLSGDQHLGTLIRHGLTTYTDGVVQFTGPAAGARYERWFEPRPTPSNGTGTPHTGDFVDSFGNRLRMLAVANPKISYRDFRERSGQSLTVDPEGSEREIEKGQSINYRDLKREGYGIVRVNHKANEFIIECWPWNTDPASSNATQFPGWPFRLPFSALDGRQKR